MKTKLIALLALVLVAPTLRAATLEAVVARGRLVEKRWKLGGAPHGVAVAPDGTVYVGLAAPQSIVAIDAVKGSVVREVVVDREEIASTKDFSTLRIARDRLYVAQGSDESVTILSLPALEVVREILLEGEPVRDALPEPAGRHLYVLGRKVHVFDAAGEREIRVLADVEPTAITTDAKGRILAVVGFQSFPNGKVSVAVFYDAVTLREIGRVPLQTEREIVSTFFAADERVLVAVARDWLAEAPATPRESRKPQGDAATMRMTIELGDLVSSETICLPDGAGPQIAAPSAGSLVVVAEKRCAAGGAFTATKRRTRVASLYGIGAYAMSPMRSARWIVTDPEGFLTIYKQPDPKE